MDFKVKRGNSYIPLISSANKSCITSAVQKRKLCGEDTVTINLTSAVYIQFQIGDTIDVFGTTYTINQLPTVKKINDRNYEYTLVFEGLQYSLIDHVFLMPDNTQGNNLMLDLEGMMDVLIDNLNRDNSGKTWKFECPSDTEYKNLSLTEKNCLQVLQQLCQEWDTEFTIVEGESDITIKIGQAGAQFPITFTYGQNGGIYELNRDKGATDLVTRLFCYGGTQNLTYYRHNRLCLPSKTKNQSYIEDATAQATYGLKEAVKNFDDIYPNRIGTVTSVSGCAYNEFIDSTMNFDLNEKWPNTEAGCEEWLALKGLEDTTQNRNIYFNDVAGTATRYLMPGATAKIHFNTGALAGYECDLHSYDPTTKKFTLIPLVDENGYDFPSKTNTTFRIGADDEYVILEINLPESYKEDAEEELQAAAEEYFATVCNPQPKYTLELEPLVLQKIIDGLHSTGDREIFATGDTVHIIDSENSVNATIRIDSFDRDLIDPYKYKLTLTDEITYTAQVRTLIEVNQIKRVIQETGIADPNKIRRGWKDAEELYNMVFDTEGQIYGEKIQPLSIDTTMLKVGARSQQLTLQNVTFQPNYLGNPARLEISGGYLVHLSIDPSGPVTWTMSAASISNLASTGLYVYAHVLRSGSTGVWLVSDQQIVFDSESGYYNFLIGTLGSVDSLTNTRTFSATYGFSTINGRYIKTGRIQSADGATWFDLDSGTINGNIVFQTSGTSYEQLQGLISGNTDVQKGVTAKSDIDNLEIGGTNLLVYNDALVNRTSGVESTKIDDYWFHIEGTLTNTADATFRPLFGVFTEANTPAKDGVYTASIECKGTMPLSDNVKVQLYSYPLGSTSNGTTTYITAANGKLTVDLTGRWLLRVCMYATAAGRTTAINGDIRFKLEKGNKRTDWSPSPEDTQAAINAEAAAQTAALGVLANRIDADIADLQNQIDGRVETWFGDYEPTDQNEPWYTWRTQTPSKEPDHLGDMFYDNTTGYAYRFTNTGTTASPVYGWLRIADSDVEEALALAREAKTAADGKMQVFITTPTPPYQEGDMWVQGANGDILYCVNEKGEQGIFEESDWATASKYTDDTTANLAMSAAETAQQAVANLEIGGRNLLKISDATVSTSSGSNGIVSTKLDEGWFHLQGTFARGTASETRPYFGIFTEANTVAKDGIFTLSVQCDNLTLDSEFRVVLGSFALGATTSRQDVFITQTNGHIVVDLTGRWLYRVMMYGTTNANQRSFNGNIRFKLEKGNKATDWSPAPEDTDAAISAVNQLVTNITSDGIIGGGKEKSELKREWQQIAGANMLGTSTDGSYAQLCTQATAYTVSHSLLDTRFNALKAVMYNTSASVYILKPSDMQNDVTLATFSLTPDDFNALWKNYYDEEQAVRDAIEDVINYNKITTLQATCDTASTSNPKVIVCPDLTADMLTDSRMRMKIVFTNRAAKLGVSTGTENLQFQFKTSASGTAITPTGASSSTVLMLYHGITANDQPSDAVYMPYWNDRQEIEISFADIINSGANARIQIVDEEHFDSAAAMQNAMKGNTRVMGGLVLTDMVVAGQGNSQSGMNGLADNDVAFWAGGSVGEAMNMNTPVVIKRTGFAKFGAVNINGQGNGELYMDSNGYRRLEIKNDTVSTASGGVAYNSNNNGNDGTNNPGESYTGLTITNSEQTKSIFEVAMLNAPTTKFVGMPIYLTIGNITVNVSSQTQGDVEIEFDITNESSGGWTTVASYYAMLNTSQTRYTNQQITIAYNSPVSGYSYLGLRMRFSKTTSSGEATLTVGNIGWHYYQDTNKMRTMIGKNGFGAYINSANQFTALSSDDQTLTATIKGDVEIDGNLNIPGVLYACRVTTNGGFTSSYNNVAVTLSKNGTSPTDTSLYNFKYTGIVGTPIIMATPEVSSDGYGWTASIESLSATNKTFSVRIKRDNAKISSAFHLVIFGTT